MGLRPCPFCRRAAGTAPRREDIIESTLEPSNLDARKGRMVHREGAATKGTLARRAFRRSAFPIGKISMHGKVKSCIEKGRRQEGVCRGQRLPLSERPVGGPLSRFTTEAIAWQNLDARKGQIVHREGTATKGTLARRACRRSAFPIGKISMHGKVVLCIEKGKCLVAVSGCL